MEDLKKKYPCFIFWLSGSARSTPPVRIHSKRTLCFILVAACLAMAAKSKGQSEQELAVELLNNSTLAVLGTTNINKFECNIIDGKQQMVKAQATYLEKEIHFREAFLKFNVADFDCGMKPITKEFQESLKSDEYPQMILEILKIKRTVADPEKAKSVQSEVRISLAGVSQNATLAMDKKIIDDSKINYQSTYDMAMSDFNIEPPTALFGQIKADDKVRIVINFIIDTKD